MSPGESRVEFAKIKEFRTHTYWSQTKNEGTYYQHQDEGRSD